MVVKRTIGEMAIFYGDKENTGQYDNGCWMDVLQIPWLSTVEEASVYKTIIHTMWIESIGWHKTIKTRWPHVTLIGLSDHPLSTHISKMSASKQHSYIDDLQYLDGIMALTEEERQWYQVAAPSKPVVNVGLPFPFKSYEEKYGKFRSQEKKYIGLGVGASDNDRNFISNLMVFKRLQLDDPSLVGVFLSVPQQLLSYCAYWADQIPNVFIQQREDMPEYYDTLSQCKLVISLTDRNTPGRLQGEAAFFGVPVVGSDRLELQNDLWPQFAVTPYSTENAYHIATSILKGYTEAPAWVERATKAAYKDLQKSNYTNSLRKFNSLVEEVKERAS